ncbi:SseB family protein [Micromonospora sp. CPCC 205539]|uniref:SseB family protein n=1 Tax=Micromonospora sp. CPCC 205539 TaxID=3122408 RepID=UPI002FF0AE2C
MTEWEPATEAEVAMRDALRANDQELYFRLLSRSDLLLPVSTPALPGQASPGWGTWTTGGRTHVLAFTSTAALRACLGDHAGTSRRVPFTDLAVGWPNHEWWLAVNPGLPVEGYLPAWFVSQLSRGDVRLPGRALGARARLERAETLARSRSGTAGRDAPPSSGSPSPGPDPTVTLPGRPSPRGSAPRVAGPSTSDASPRQPGPSTADASPRQPGPSTADASPRQPGLGELLRPSGGEDMPAAGQRFPTGPPRRGGPGTGPAASPGRPTASPGWPTASRYAPLASADQPGVVPADRPSLGTVWPPAKRPAADVDAPAAGDGSAQGGRRSFFEPASGPASGAGRPGDRAAPPSRLGRGGQPFPRRRPADAPGENAARPFPMPDPDATRPLRPPPVDPGAPSGARAPAMGDLPTQPLRPRPPNPLAEEPTRAFRVPGPATGEPLQTRAGWTDLGAEPTQAIPRGRPGEPRRFEPAEELPASLAEPVSGPPAPRRGFTPIVIEGTIIESRDLTDPAEGPGPGDAARRPGPEPVAPPTFGPSAFGPSAFEPASFGPPSFGPPSFGPPSFAPASSDPSTSDPSTSDPSTSDPSTSDPGPADRRTPDPSPPRAAGPSGPSLFGSVPSDPSPPEAIAFGSSPSGSSPFDQASSSPVAGDVSGARTNDLAGDPDGGDRGGTGLWPGRVDDADRTGGDVGRASFDDYDGQSARPATGSGPAATRADTSADGQRVQASDDGQRVQARDDGQGVQAYGDGPRASAGGDGQHGPTAVPVDFQPANTVEEDLLGAAGAGSTDTFLSTLLLARVLLPAAPDSVRGSRPGDSGFVWRTGQLDGETYVVVYTSPERLADHVEGDVDTVGVKFAQLIRRWPDEDWSFAVNPGTPVGAKLPGEQIVALANWAAEVGLGDDLEVDPEEAPAEAEPTARPRYAPTAVDPAQPTVMQKAIAPSQLAYYLERGYDRVSGFVHRAGELAHLTTPAQLYDALGLSYPDSPFARDAEEIYVLRWPAHRPSLYRIPYGGQNEPAMRAMEGWVIERPPFRGNGFAPGESSDVVAEFKVDSARLPHGAQLWRVGADGTERVVAVLDTDTLLWRRVGEA